MLWHLVPLQMAHMRRNAWDDTKWSEGWNERHREKRWTKKKKKKKVEQIINKREMRTNGRATQSGGTSKQNTREKKSMHTYNEQQHWKRHKYPTYMNRAREHINTWFEHLRSIRQANSTKQNFAQKWYQCERHRERETYNSSKRWIHKFLFSYIFTVHYLCFT